MRERVDSLVGAGEPVSEVVLLSTVTGLGPSPGTASAPVSYNAAESYVRETGLDPDRWRERNIHGFGLICALTMTAVHFVRSTGSMRKGEIELAFAWPRSETTLSFGEGASIPGARTALLHFAGPDSDYVVGSAPLGRVATNEMNDVASFVEAWGPSALAIEEG